MDPEELPSRNKYSVLILVLSLLLIGIAALYFLNKISPWRTGFGKSPVDLFQFNLDTETPGEKVIDGGERPAPLLTDIDSDDRGDARFLTKILKGYFHEYGEANKVIGLKNRFLGSPNLQLLEASIRNTTSFYCWPETHNDGSRSVDVKNLEFYIYPDNRDIVFPGERRISIDLLGDFLNPNAYLIIQLIDNFDINNDNQVQKLILLGC